MANILILSEGFEGICPKCVTLLPIVELLMQRKFLSNLLYLLFLNFLIKPFWIFGIDVEVQNTVGAEEYGLYYSLFNFSLLFNILLDFGITNYNNRNIAQFNHMLGRYFSGIIFMKVLLGVLYLVVALVVALVVDYSSRAISILLLLAFNQFLLSMILYLRSNLAGLMLFRLDSTLSIMDRMLMIIICGTLLWGNVLEGEFQIEYFVYAQTMAYVITAITIFAIVAFKAGKFNFKMNLPLLKLIIRQSFPFALLILLMAFYYRLDSVMIERMLPDGKTQTGIYAQAYRLLDAVNMIGFLFAGLLLPIFSKMIVEKESITKLVRLSFSLIFIPSICVALISMFFSEEIMDLLYVENVTESASVLVLLMFCFIAISSTYIYGTLLTANGSLKELNRIAIFGLLMNVFLNLIFIPAWKALGAATATLVTQLLVASLQIFVVKRKFKLEDSLKYNLKLSSIVAFLLLIGFCLRPLDFHWILKSIGILISAALSVILLRIISISDLLSFVQRPR